MKVCPECRQTWDDMTEVCPRCGVSLAGVPVKPQAANRGASKKCPMCGEVYPASAHTCYSCGCSLDGEQAAPQRPKVVGLSLDAVTRQYKSNRLFYILEWVVLLAGLAMMALNAYYNRIRVGGSSVWVTFGVAVTALCLFQVIAECKKYMSVPAEQLENARTSGIGFRDLFGKSEKWFLTQGILGAKLLDVLILGLLCVGVEAEWNMCVYAIKNFANDAVHANEAWAEMIGMFLLILFYVIRLVRIIPLVKARKRMFTLS